MLKKLEKLFILTIITYLIVSSSVVYATSGGSTLDEFLPSGEDISHGFRNEEYQNETLNEDGFMEGRSVSYNRQLDNYIIMQLHIRVYKFSSTETAYTYYNKTIDEIKSTQIYDEVEIPSAFAFITFEDADVGTSWVILDNIISNVEVINEYTFEDTEEMLVYYTQLQQNNIPEFQSMTLILIFLVATISLLITKKKLTTEK